MVFKPGNSGFELADEAFADDFSFAFRVGYAREPGKIAFRSVHHDQVIAKQRSEDGFNLVGFVFAH